MHFLCTISQTYVLLTHCWGVIVLEYVFLFPFASGIWPILCINSRMSEIENSSTMSSPFTDNRKGLERLFSKMLMSVLWPKDCEMMEVLKARLDETLRNLVWWKLSLSMSGGLELDNVQDLFQPKPFYDSIKAYVRRQVNLSSLKILMSLF